MYILSLVACQETQKDGQRWASACVEKQVGRKKEKKEREACFKTTLYEG